MDGCDICVVQTVMKHAVEHYFGGGSELLNMHERMADLLLIALSSSFEDAGDHLSFAGSIANRSHGPRQRFHTHVLPGKCLYAGMCLTAILW